ncbi:MAG: hypothetical protein KGJ74_13115 [Betaproteobacteria bacterium]|jgi:hypothetical protein|uniref:Uncharacterized protein n=1 Tax=Thiomonas delicata TaxID=364030 RepID=A0A238D0D3_THIDL|nr:MULTISPECIES: hypothetical protein [Thiomonas]MDE2130591.1 hypothetical protein [Betaproteobacteria bacterium]OZB44703.1 MAG: hypothetical protein B7X46_07715 [Thiomonas sp. 15-66-11]SBP86717.1 conserved hypothetical protein [Thiomonas delicata]
MAQYTPTKIATASRASVSLNDPAAAERMAQLAQVYIENVGMCRLESVRVQAVAEATGQLAIVVDEDGQGYIALAACELLPKAGIYRVGRVSEAGRPGEDLYVVEHSREGAQSGEAVPRHYVHIMRRLTH